LTAESTAGRNLGLGQPVPTGGAKCLVATKAPTRLGGRTRSLPSAERQRRRGRREGSDLVDDQMQALAVRVQE
jgi:hypothetical protein